MFPYFDVEAKHRRLACAGQVCALAILVSVLAAGVVRMLTQKPEMAISLVDAGKPPWVCLCCDLPVPNEVLGAGASGPGGSVTIAFEAGCACADFTALELPLSAKLGVMCKEGYTVRVKSKMEPDSPMKNVNGMYRVYEGWVHFFLTKKQVGWDYMYSQSIEDEYTSTQALWQQNNYYGPDHFTGSSERWVWNVEGAPHGHAEMLWLSLEDQPVLRILSLGFLPQLFKVVSGVGGLLGIFSAAWAGMFVKKNTEHIFAKVYNERTLVFTKLLSTWMGAGLQIPLEGSKLPPPPGIGLRDTE